MEYPGRVIIIGQDPTGKNLVVIYAITGRSPSSQARKLTFQGNAIWAQPTDEKTIKMGNIDLLIYPSIFFSTHGIAVSNGKQTSDIGSSLGLSQNPVEVLSHSLSRWDYEPDSPIFTPRISGCVLLGKKAALSIIRRGPDGSSQRRYYDIPPKAGLGKMISTYAGVNRDPLPSFTEEPVEVEIQAQRADELAKIIYDALGPEMGKEDFRVSVACVYFADDNTGQNEIFTINRNKG
jgi:IMP cyclohydrolase